MFNDGEFGKVVVVEVPSAELASRPFRRCFLQVWARPAERILPAAKEAPSGNKTLRLRSRHRL